MRNVLIVNMSPRVKGTSALLAGLCAEHLEKSGHLVERVNLYQGLQDPDGLYGAVKRADTLVLSGPSYINTYPADATAFLEGMAARPEILRGQSLYGIIQGGMPYAHTHESGLNMLGIFAKKCGVRYLGGFVMGLGAMLNGASLDRLFNARKVKRQLGVFFDHIGKGEPSPRQVYLDAQIHLPVVAYRLLAMMANRAIDKQQKKYATGTGQSSPSA